MNQQSTQSPQSRIDIKLFEQVFINGSPMLLRHLLSFLTPKETTFIIQLNHRLKISNPDKKCILFKYLLRCHPSNKIISQQSSQMTNHTKATIISQIWKQHSNLCINCLILPCYEWMYSSSISNQYPHISILCSECARNHWDRLTAMEPRKIPFVDLLISNVNCSQIQIPYSNCKQCLISPISDWPPVWKATFPVLNRYCFQCAYYLYPFHIIPTVDVKLDKLIPNRSQTFYAPTLKQGQTKFRLIVPKVLVTDISSHQPSFANISKKRKRQNQDVDNVLATIGDFSSNRKTNLSSNDTNSSDMRNLGSLRRSSRLGKRLVIKSN